MDQVKQPYSQSLLLALTLCLGGCAGLPFFGGGGSEVAPAPAPAPAPPPAQSVPNPVVPPPSKPAASSLLFPSTDPQKRLVLKGRKDPFDALMPMPIITLQLPPPKPKASAASTSPQTVSPGSPSSSGTSPGTNGGGRKKAAPSPSSPTTMTKPRVKPVTMPKLVFPKALPFELPRLPEPTLAREIVVTGVVKLNGSVQIFFRTPLEKVTRSARAGDFIAGGQVKVKRVDLTPGRNPVVILEQFGVEVRKTVDSTIRSAAPTPPPATPAPASAPLPPGIEPAVPPGVMPMNAPSPQTTNAYQ